METAWSNQLGVQRAASTHWQLRQHVCFTSCCCAASLLGHGQRNNFDQQHQLLRRVETNNWQLSWMICLLNFFISGVLDLRQLCKCAVFSYPWPWWPGPFTEEVLKMYQDKQQQKQQQQTDT
jgi:hypothetical protein